MSTTGTAVAPSTTMDEPAVPPPSTTSVDNIDSETLNTILGLNALKNSTSAAPTTQAPQSSSGSSSLSELDDEDENIIQDHDADGSPDEEDDDDVDSEAETERLQDSPHKPRPKPILHRAESNLRHHESINDASSSDDDGMDVDLLNGTGADEPSERKPDGSRLSPNTLAGTKRKRAEGPNGSFLEPMSKRIVSEQRAAASDTISSKMKSADIVPDIGSPALSEISDVSERSYPDSSEEEQATSGEGSEVLKIGDDKVTKLEDEDAVAKPLEEDAHGDVEDHEVHVDGEEEEDDGAEASAKGEDEMVRKLKAVADLVPIEKLFNMFRDKLHEERLAAIDAELSLLNDHNCIHPDFMAQRQSIDARRDEKILLEQIQARFRRECLDRTIVATRAQVNCQFFQEARSIREDCVARLNDMYCRIQQERRQLKTREPQYIFTLEPKRSQRIVQQTAYNKEVSLLSGIARHVGFPAAPEIKGARPSEMDDDFRAMGLT